MKTRRDPSGVTRVAQITSNVTSDARLAHVYAVDEYARPGLASLGFGPPRAKTNRAYANKGWIPFKWPSDLWYREYTQYGRNYLHIAITVDQISLRVHIDGWHDDQLRNDIALEIVREEIEPDLLAQLPAHDDPNWQAARGGKNQVCAVSVSGGFGRGEPQRDAEWVVAAAKAWLYALQRHPVHDLRQRVEDQLERRL